jgi:primosomal protein N' (replication factor Y) (superfamily II helicase)
MPQIDENTLGGPRYVEVALPLPLRRTFTYSVPEGFREVVKPGARLLVPFGKRNITGYAVALFSELDEGSEIDVSAIKSAVELLDETPLITEEILRLTQWTADYYAASWGEVLKASLPAGINAAYEQVISITESGRNELLRITNAKPLKVQILHRIAEQDEIIQRDIEKEFGAARTKRAVRELTNGGLISVHQRSITNKVKPKLRKAVRLLASTNGSDKPITSAQQIVIDTLQSSGGEMIFTELIAKCRGSSAVNTLAKRGLVEVFIQEVLRDPLTGTGPLDTPELVLNVEQLFVLNEIERALEPNEFQAFLLHGVTGSGKTEIYIRAMRSALERGKSALMLVPEIALTPIFSRRLRAVFGDEVAILHSNLSQGERFDEWRRIRAGRARIVIGTRSAVFAPLQKLGLIIVDEEHDTSYRQHESPFYHARDVAIMRASLTGAVVVLGSATPALESYHNAQTGKYHYLQLRNRIGNRPLAQAELIDMREVFRARGKDVTLSPQLVDAIRETHAKGEQSIILLNRRGFSRFVLCRSCGESLRCKNCDITLTYHKIDGRITCHYCGYSVDTPRICPFCEGEYLYFIGEGTEQLEDILARMFTDLRIARIDRDTMSRRGQLTQALVAFSRGETDMLVGTQMLAKGHDFHNVTLVGVISVDAALGLPDFRSSERTFQLLTQVAGRAGRGELPGRVLIQTYYPEHYALRYACQQDYEGFFQHEMQYRNRLSYPPFVVLASILIKHADRDYAFRNASFLKESLDRANHENACRVLGVSPASLSRLRGEYRFQILLKSTGRKKLRETLDLALADAEERGCDMRTVFTQIDPVDLM